MTGETETRADYELRIKGEIGLCRMHDCLSQAKYRGLCAKHYQWYRSQHAARRKAFAAYAGPHKTTRRKPCPDRTIYYLRSLVKRNASIFVNNTGIVAVDGDVVYQIMPDGKMRKAKFSAK